MWTGVKPSHLHLAPLLIPPMKPLLRTSLALFLLLHFLPVSTAFGQPAPADARRLSDYTGTYAYRPKYGTVQYGTLELLPKDSVLLAIIDEAKYPLRWVRPNIFLNALGDTVTFRRDAAGQVTGFSDGGTFNRRLKATTAMSAASLNARLLPNGSRPRYRYRAPDSAPADGLPAKALSGTAPALLTAMVQAVVDEQYPGVHSVLVWQRGRLALEEYFYGHDRQKLQQLRSASKSFVSALVGAAIQRQLISSDTARLLPYLPYASYAHPDARKQAWTVQDFLTMRTGLDCNDHDERTAGHEEKMYPQVDWVKFILDLPLTSAPGTQGAYCSGAVAVLGRVVENVSGQRLPQFAEASLFRPLGITTYKWNYTLGQSNPTVAQLFLTPRDLLKFGLLYLQRGRWQGQQVLPAAWVEKSLGKYTQLGSKSYGYFWWHQPFMAGSRRVDTYLATGNGGQKLFVIPALDAVVVFTGGNYNSATDTPPNKLMPQYVLPALLAGEGAGK